MSGQYASYWNAFLLHNCEGGFKLLLSIVTTRKVTFSQVCVKNSVHRGFSVPACTTGHMTRGVCPGGALSGGFLSRGVSVLGSGGLCLEGSLSREVSVQGVWGVSVQGRGSLSGGSLLG